MCDHEGTRCKGCLEARYCSQDCQRTDWPVHKPVCEAYAEFSDVRRLSEYHKRALSFAEVDNLPRFVWLEVQPRADDDKANGETGEATLEDRVLVPQLKLYLGTLNGFLSQGGIEKDEMSNTVLHRKIGRGITVAGRLTNNTDSLPGNHQVNKSPLAIEKEPLEIWFGDVVACGFTEDTKRIQDLNLMDFRHLVDIIGYIYDHTRRECNEKFNSHRRIHPCAAEEKLGCRFLGILPTSAAQFDAKSEVATPIMTRIGIPLVFRRLPPETRGRDRKLGLPRKLIGWNPTLRPFDPTIPLCDWRHGVGKALVVRKDGKPLCQTYVAAFVDYVHKTVSYCHDNRETARGVLDSYTKGDFMGWYDG
ncbi:uncharacterized protein EKO05_0001138 [Ascochyta rabiei]|uniref:Calcium ion binding n=1 Tax=Didymella rabiei TaxID=5454 RepID=A0A162YS51_DIDRA|nr:uncharacterized protein EKO05_0001138 [Ascochyta rabiei]KZM20196.1 calcium ion binding [Ascochyta rabiei]UPX10480.1 hypothetical protein EKO05_0001138 [Ascochyta rabiei]